MKRTRMRFRSFLPLAAALMCFVAAACEKPPEEGLSDGSAYLPDPEVLERVRNTELEVLEPDGLRFGTATLQARAGNMRVVRLTGPTPYELGYQHGILLKDSITSPTFQVYADPLYQGQPPPYKTPEEIELELEQADRKVFGPLERNTPLEYLQELKGIADGSGLDYKTVFRATFLSDYKMVTILASALGPVGECSGLLASGAATSSGELVVGRNTDYEGQKQWVEGQVILFYDFPGAQRYASVSTAGLLKCNSAMNETGMVVGGHFMVFTPAEPHGISFTIFENEIMRKTSSLAEVVTLLAEKPRCGSFGLTVGDGKTGEALAFEASSERLGIRNMQDEFLVMTNFAVAPEQVRYDAASKMNIQMRDLWGRYARLESLARLHHGEIDPAKMAEFMSDSVDAIPEVGRERGGGNIVCGAPNVTSVVFLPARGFFWVASGESGIPSCRNEYVGYDFWAELSGETPSVTPSALPGYAWSDDRRRAGLEAYMQAELAYQVDKTDVDTILAHLASARAADPEEPKYYRAEARYLLRRGLDPATANTADLDAAITLLEQSLDPSVVGTQANNERALSLLYLGRALDLTGNREAAQTCYSGILSMLQVYGWRNFPSGLNKMLAIEALMGTLSPFTGTFPEGFALSLYE